MNRNIIRSVLVTGVLMALGLAPRPSSAQLLVQPNRSNALRENPFQRPPVGNVLLLPSEQRYVIMASGLLRSEVRHIRFSIGALPSEGDAPRPNRRVAQRYPRYNHYWQITADPLQPTGLPAAAARHRSDKPSVAHERMVAQVQLATAIVASAPDDSFADTNDPRIDGHLNLSTAPHETQPPAAVQSRFTAGWLPAATLWQQVY